MIISSVYNVKKIILCIKVSVYLSNVYKLFSKLLANK